MAKLLRVDCTIEVLSKTETTTEFKNNFLDLINVDSIETFCCDMLTAHLKESEDGVEFQQGAVRRKTSKPVDADFVRLDPKVQFDNGAIVEYVVTDDKGSYTVIEKFFALSE
jgi:hypothetical protein